jgi:predicted enzyme related to lactoylglutathione lyase
MTLFMVEIRVAKWRAAIEWYSNVLGLELVLVDEANSFALLAAGEARVSLRSASAPGDRAAVRLVFEVADLEAERDRLVKHGVAVGAIQENAAEKFRFLKFKDPEGTPIRLFSWGANRA